MAWEKVDPYHARQGEYTMTRALVCGNERFSIWFGKRHMRTFDSAADASVWAKWVEDNSREKIEAVKVTKPLTKDQMELI
jgi:hypothetical protein